ncbi:ABC transporter ATP-binding protein [Rhizobium sp. RAF56]|uniref:ABC transporter ATP-binding protein n=1 Tax=Rhizobium sp. RAF56 TaxID=3233062 RepID=UPI003F975D4C
MHALRAHELYRFFHTGEEEVAALRGVSFSLKPGEILAFVGPSGSGKSTLLACVAGLDRPDGGFVEFNGVRLTWKSEAERTAARRSGFGIVLASDNLFPHLTVQENVELSLALARRSAPRKVGSLLASLGLGHCRYALPAELSGGEAARAGLAAALIADPPILVADEPTAEVDRETEERVIDLLLKRKTDGKATLLATHSPALAQVTDRVITLRDGKTIDDAASRR